MTRCRVVKVGGSLLDVDDLPQRLTRWLEDQPHVPHVLLAGGGPLADVIRDADARFQLGAAAGHWLCVRAMDVTARLLHQLLAGSRFLDSYDELADAVAGGARGPLVFSPEPFLRDVEPELEGTRLSHDWRTTSDSIAARLAAVLRAELVLLKSTDYPDQLSVNEAARRGLVDAFFPAVAGTAPPRWVNLRSFR